MLVWLLALFFLSESYVTKEIDINMCYSCILWYILSWWHNIFSNLILLFVLLPFLLQK